MEAGPRAMAQRIVRVGGDRAVEVGARGAEIAAPGVQERAPFQRVGARGPGQRSLAERAVEPV